MTYGSWLDRATTAIHAARHAAETTRASGHDDAATTFAARNAAYRHLVQLTNHLGGRRRTQATIKIAEHVVNSDARLATTSPARILGVGLRAAVATAPTPAGPADGGELARHLTTAADALGVAADILTSHLGAPNQPTRTPEGYALSIGTGRPGAWADLARLAGDLIELDRRLPAWLSRGHRPRTLRPVYQPTIERLRWWTSSRYPTIVKRIASRTSGESVLRLLDTVPATELPAGARAVNSLRDVQEVLDAARAWLHQHPDRAQHSHILAATRLAVTLSSGAARLDPAGPLDAATYAHRWSQVARKLQPLAGLDRLLPDPFVQELDSASDWLGHRIRTQPQDRGYADAEWDAAAPRLLGKLPGLATQLDRAVATAAGRGHLAVAQSELDLTTNRHGVYHAKARWRIAKPADDQIKALRDKLDAAGRVLGDREHALRQALGDPVALARSAYPQPPTSAAGSTMTTSEQVAPGHTARRTMAR